MKTIGLIGGMSWESSLLYYQIINEEVKKRLGGLHSAPIILYSFDFNKIEKLQHQNRWNEIFELIVDAAKRLETAGADFIVICTNTIHKLADQIQKEISIPIINIIDETAQKIKEKGFKKVGLLGTRFTMEGEFYKDRIIEYGIDVIIPGQEDRQSTHEIIYSELCLGLIKESSKIKFQSVIQQMIRDGAEGIILGCTEIPLLIKQEDIDIPLLDTTIIHALSAVDNAITADK
ncbi:MAG: aspartate/glutamate racemase family protein [Candidatus Hodarchaeales archaeon]|jgi:aspartate racemase